MLLDGQRQVPLAPVARPPPPDAPQTEPSHQSRGQGGGAGQLGEVVPDPGEDVAVPVGPGAAADLGEVDPRIGAVPHVHEHVVEGPPAAPERLEPRHGAAGGSGRQLQQPVVPLPHGRHVPLPAAVADDDVRQQPVPVPRRQVLRQQVEVRVARLSAHDVVAQRPAAPVGREGGVVGQGI